MKTVLPIALVVSVTTDFTIGSPHEVLPENPHTELEVTAPAPPASQTTTLTSGSDSEPLAHFRWETFHREMLRANTVKDKFAMNDALLTTARTLVRNRHLKDWERVMQYDMLKFEIKMMYRRTRGRRDCSGALPAIAAALGVSNTPVDFN